MSKVETTEYYTGVAGDRVQLHPATDLWMRGARYGTVTKVTWTKVYVLVDALERVIRFRHEDVIPVS